MNRWTKDRCFPARFTISILILVVGVGAAAWAQSGDRRLYQDAESRFRSRDYELALQRYDQLLSEYPLSSFVPDVQFRRAVCNFRLGNQEEALELFRRVETRYPTSSFIAFVPFWIGVIHYNQQNYVDAKDYLQRYLEGGEQSLTGQARLYLAISNDKLGNTEAAVENLEAMIADEDSVQDLPYAVSFLASLYVRTEQYRKMIDLADTIGVATLDDQQRDRIALYRAESLWHLDEREQAVEVYSTLLESAPEIASIAFQRLFVQYQSIGDDDALQNTVNNAEIQLSGYPTILRAFWLRIGIEHYGEGKVDLARSYFQRIWNMGNRSTADGLVPLYLAEIQYRDGEKEEAIKTIRTFLAESDDRRELLVYRLAGFYIETERWSEASDTYGLFIREFPQTRFFSEAAYFRSFALYKQQLHAEAISQIDEVLTAARGEAYTSRLLRLKSVLHKEDGDLETAAATLREYIPLEPEDMRARMDLVKLLFRKQDFDGTIREVEKVRDIDPFNDPSTTYFILSRYMLGLAHITRKEYSSAVDVLTQLEASHIAAAGLQEISPYVLYYRGWAYYRDGDYAAAEENFAELLRSAPDHELQPRAAYLAGWCAFVVGDFAGAESYLIRIGPETDPDLKRKTEFLYAKSLDGLDRPSEAVIKFENIYLDDPGASLADDSLFEFADALASLDKVEESVSAYRRLFDEYPRSELAEEAMYKRGEILYDRGMYEAAREAFYEYRTEFPGGTLVDAALYWGAMASLETGEPFGAVLLWEKLIDGYKSSAFRADSLYRTAQVYEDSGDFRKALNYYGELISVYPEEAKAVSAEEKAEKIRYLILGQGETEAELSVVIGREGSNTKDGRQAMLDLARIYIYKSGTKQNLAPALLAEVIDKQDEDPQSAAQARYLFGEYYYRKNDLQRAADEFLGVISITPTDRDLVAQALYRAAEMMKLSGDMRAARSMVERIEKNFPSSQWVEAGRKLIEDER